VRRDIGPRSYKFLLELRAFCQAQDGRAARLAEYLGCKPAAVYNWWNIPTTEESQRGKQARFPTLEQALCIQEWRKIQEIRERIKALNEPINAHGRRAGES
jgi:hypothetical protein